MNGPRHRLGGRCAAAAPWLAISLALFGYGMWLLNDANWVRAFFQMLLWSYEPATPRTWPPLPGWPMALAGTVLALLVGAVISLALLPPGEFDRSLGAFFAWSALLGLSTAGWGVQIAAAVGRLSLPAAIAWLVLIGVASTAAARHRLGSLREVLVRITGPASSPPPSLRWQMLLNAALFIPMCLIGLFVAVHALFLPVTEWDALIYHAATAKLWYLHRPAPPVIAGPSVGIEVSYNFPSLFPGIGTYYYLLTGGAHDVYLRVLAPFLGLITAILVYRAARRISGVPAGFFAALILLTTPLFLEYIMFPTSYALLMPLGVAALDCLAGAWQTHQAPYLLAGGVLLGLAANVTYLSALLGAYVALFGISLAARGMIRRTVVVGAAVAALAVAGPVYVRNWVNVGDPVFPLGASLFRSPYIPDRSMLRDAVREVRNNALGYWSGKADTVAEGATLLWDNNLLPTGMLSLLGAWLVPARPGTGVHGGWILFLGLSQLAQGWYWIRTLTMFIPSAAVLLGIALAHAAAAPSSWPRSRWALLSSRIAARSLRAAVGVLLVLICLFPGITLAWTGPAMQESTATTRLRPWDDYSAAWHHLGESSGWLAYVYPGDYQAWRWLRQHLRPDERVATLEPRWYYLGDGTVFYLDGLESTPLLRLQRAPEIARFLRTRGVRFILAPPWVESGRGAYPLVARLALYRFLGSSQFPLITAFRVVGHNVVRIYAVSDPRCPAAGGDGCP